MSQRKRRYESVSEDDNESDCFYEPNKQIASSQQESRDIDSDIDDDGLIASEREDICNINFEGPSSAFVHHPECFDVDSDFNSDSDSESDDESDFDGEDDTDFDDDWDDWDEILDPLAQATSEGHEEEVIWENVPSTFAPRKDIPPDEETEVFVEEDSLPSDLFFKLFPQELIEWIVECTNERLDILAEKKGKEKPHTDSSEMILVLGVLLVMAYNRVPHMAMYWSQHPSLGNKTIKNAMSRNRFLLLASKLYFNHPKKPHNADRTYYTNVLVKHLKTAFQRIRAESTRQSIDETMVKFKGRSIIKQYMPKKTIKRGTKIYTRSCAKSGFCYDMFVYKGKEAVTVKGTLGERVVRRLCKSIRGRNVAICMDRFFTSYEMMKKSPFPLVGTCITNRRNVPTMAGKLAKGESMAQSTTKGVIAFKWQDTKEVTLLSNCHTSEISSVERKQKNGEKKSFPCPEAIAFYNKFMGGVDMTDQYTLAYDINRKTNKWWKRVFQRLLMTAVTNAWIVYKQLKKKKIALIDFMVPLSDHLIEIGKSGSKIQRSYKTGRPSKRAKNFVNVQHLPVPCTKRRCRYCASKNLQKRTKFVCLTCDVPLCAKCFLPYHQ